MGCGADYTVTGKKDDEINSSFPRETQLIKKEQRIHCAEVKYTRNEINRKLILLTTKAID